MLDLACFKQLGGFSVTSILNVNCSNISEASVEVGHSFVFVEIWKATVHVWNFFVHKSAKATNYKNIIPLCPIVCLIEAMLHS